MSFASLDIALTGLRVNRQGIDVLSNNIANAQTEGYTRKILPQEAVVAGNDGIGVRSLEVERYVDEFLMRDFRNQLSSTSYLDTTALAVVGIGNVALDVARVLVKTPQELGAACV